MDPLAIALISDPHPHAGGDPLQHCVHILDDILGPDPHHADADAFEALVTTLGERVVLPCFIDCDGHAKIVTIEVDDRAANNCEALECVTAEIGFGETRCERLVRF